MGEKVLLLPTARVSRGELRCDVGECTRSVRPGDRVGIVWASNTTPPGGEIELPNPSRVVLRRVDHGVLT